MQKVIIIQLLNIRLIDKYGVRQTIGWNTLLGFMRDTGTMIWLSKKIFGRKLTC